MLYLGIDLHRKQMTISLRNHDGDVLLRRQVSTRWPKLEEFREQLQQAAADDEKYVAVVEVCGFHDWLVKWLQQDERCHKVLVVQPLGRSATKTDRRDAHALIASIVASVTIPAGLAQPEVCRGSFGSDPRGTPV